jgi:hypothetical protein
MSRDSNGNYSLPQGPVISGTVISSNWANPTMNDIAAALTDSLSRTGQGGLLTSMLFPDGTMKLPAVAFINGVNSGIYLAGDNDVRMTVNGFDVTRWIPNKFQYWDGAVWLDLYQDAAHVSYDNTTTTMPADNVQDALDYLYFTGGAGGGGIVVSVVGGLGILVDSIDPENPIVNFDDAWGDARYATAAQGAEADSAVQSVSVAAGIVSTGTEADAIVGLDYSIVTTAPTDVGATVDGHIFYVIPV